MKFTDFKTAVQRNMDEMTSSDLFRTDVSKEDLWTTYLSSFPEGTNPIRRERTEHDCQCCKQFIRACGNVVSITSDNKLTSIWDVDVGGYYQVVADALSRLVKEKYVVNKFLHYEQTLGTDFNHQLNEDGSITTWNHFYYKLPRTFVVAKKGIDTKLGQARDSYHVFKRGLDEISIDAANTVLELIGQNSLYRGEEHKQAVTWFLMHKKQFNKLRSEYEKNNYAWSMSSVVGGFQRIRNSSIGTLLLDLSQGKDLDVAVKAFEAMVAPANYKRPTALITKSMITNAQKKVKELGIEEALPRRHATIEDITINNILFADREVKKEMDVFDVMAKEAPVKAGRLKKVEEVGVDVFINDILPRADTIEVELENSHTPNLMSLLAPVNKDAPSILKWDNNFSWTYNGEVADSIKERVKQAGGDVGGVLRCSLAWFNYDDLDIHVREPAGGIHISYSNKRNIRTTGKLDVDMNAGGKQSRSAVENITWTNKSKMKEGVYHLYVNQYRKRENTDPGFTVEVEYGGVIHTFHYDRAVRGGVTVAEFKFTRAGGIEFIKSLPSTQATKEMWGLHTNHFHKVKMIMNSPNHWDNKPTGNKHWFFILEGCKNDEPVRGFFNEFLKGNLNEHRKVFEVLGSKMKADVSDEQLSGLGFSSTQRNSILCRVKGSFSRTIKVNF